MAQQRAKGEVEEDEEEDADFNDEENEEDDVGDEAEEEQEEEEVIFPAFFVAYLSCDGGLWSTHARASSTRLTFGELPAKVASSAMCSSKH